MRLKTFEIIGGYRITLLKLLLAAATGFGVLIIARFLQGIVTKRSHTRAIRYNMVRLIRLITIIIIAFNFYHLSECTLVHSSRFTWLNFFITWLCFANPIASLIGGFIL